MKKKFKPPMGMWKVHLPSLLILIVLSFNSDAQWTTNVNDIYNSNTGNVGIGTTTPAVKLQVIGESRFGSATNYAKVSSAGVLSFAGTGYYNVAGNKYVFKQTNGGNRGLYINKTNTRFEFRDSTANDLFHLDYYTGEAFSKKLSIGYQGDIPGVSNLVLGGNPNDKGGQLQLRDAFYAYSVLMHANGNRFRISEGSNTGSPTKDFEIDDGNIVIHANSYYNYDSRLTVKADTTFGVFGPTGWISSSDQRLKTNIKPIEHALNNISMLEGVSYNWKANPDDDSQIGFIAQDVEKIYPEVICVDPGPEGKYSMAPQNLVAPVVEAIKEQQIKMDETGEDLKDLNAIVECLQNENKLLAPRLDQFDQALVQCCTNTGQGTGRSDFSANENLSKLEQEGPNPFSEKTIIHYSIPEGESVAILKIYSLAGEEMKTIPLSSGGSNHVELPGNTLSSGTYTYLLMVDGKTVDTKQMILTR